MTQALNPRQIAILNQIRQAGRVFVENRTDGGQGARFVVELPLLEVRGDDVEEEHLSDATP